MILLAAATSVAWAGWSDARQKADAARSKGDEVHRELPGEMRSIVSAMCQASDDDLRSPGEAAASNARSTVRDQVDDFHQKTQDAIESLQPVANDSDDANHDTASELIDQLRDSQSKLDDLTRPLLDGNPPVIDYIVQHAESARRDHGSCSARDVWLDGNRVPCLVVDDDTCTVLEVSFDNERSIGNARGRADREKEAVEREIQKDSPDSAVRACKHVTARVDCFKVCPDIDGDGQIRDTDASWRERC